MPPSGLHLYFENPIYLDYAVRLYIWCLTQVYGTRLKVCTVTPDPGLHLLLMMITVVIPIPH